MIRPCRLKTKLRRPLTKLLHEAVRAYYDQVFGMEDGGGNANGPSPEQSIDLAAAHKESPATEATGA